MSTEAIFELAMIQTHQDKKRGWSALRDLYRAGELERVGRGEYRSRARSDAAPKKQTVMWRFLKMRRVVTVDDLVVAGEASQAYAREWLRGLVRKEIVKKREDGAYVLIQDLPAPEPPRDDAKAEALRELRRRRRQRVLDALDQIHANVCDICGTMEELADAIRGMGEEE